MTGFTGSSFARPLRPSLFTVALALSLSASSQSFAQSSKKDGGGMWSGQVAPDFRSLDTSPAEKTEAGEWIVKDINLLASYARIRDVDNQLKVFKFKILRMNTATPGDAFARRGSDGQLEIYYSAAFEGKLTRPEFLGKYITLTHEIGHHLLKHTETNAPAITQQDELKADQMAGCLFSGVVSNLKKPLGPADQPRETVHFSDVEKYFLKHQEDRDDGVHARINVRLDWVWSGWAFAMQDGHCHDIRPPKP